MTFGLVELAIFTSAAGDLIQPRVLAKTLTIRRQVIRIQGGAARMEFDLEEDEAGAPRELKAHEKDLLEFWSELAHAIPFDDPAQQPPNPSGKAFVTLRMPSPRAWTTLFLSAGTARSGVFLTFNRGEPGDSFYRRLLDERDTLEAELPPGVEWDSDGSKHSIGLSVRSPRSPIRASALKRCAASARTPTSL